MRGEVEDERRERSEVVDVANNCMRAASQRALWCAVLCSGVLCSPVQSCAVPKAQASPASHLSKRRSACRGGEGVAPR